MKATGTLEYVFFNQRKCNVEKKFSQTTLTLMTLLLWISPGLGDDKPPDCAARDLEFCSSPCTYLRERCNGNRECTLGLCSYLHPQLPPGDFETCWRLLSDCAPESRSATKRGLLNKNVAYLLLKLHPFLNQTSQYGFLTSGRFRRITGNFGTEFLGKRSNNKSAGSRTSGRGNQTPPKPKPTPQFYSLPLNKFAKSKVLKRGYEDLRGFFAPEKRLSVRGNGKVILGSEFLGKRGDRQNDRMRRLSGTEFLGKRNEDPFDGSEFLGKRIFAGSDDPSPKRQHDPLSGTELLGKKSSQESSGEVQMKRFGNELLGKRMGPSRLRDAAANSRRGFGSSNRNGGFGFLSDYDPELFDEAFSSYESLQSPRFPIGSHSCQENDSAICGKFKVK